MIKNLIELTGKITGFKGVSADSRKIGDGFVFVAIKGGSSDGHDYINSAVKNGAKVIVGEEDVKITGAEYLKVDDSREALGILSSAFFGNPSEKLKVIGVTGTKGKTTTAYLLYHMLGSLGKKAGLVTSIAAKIGEKEIDTGFHVTSPDVISLHKILREMVDAGCEYAVIEVSSHGIDQKRIAGVKFDVGVLTNIAPEHLDYHKTFAEYKRVKMSFMNSCKFKVFSPTETGLDILPGKFNNLNAEAALKVIEILGLDREKALASLHTFNLPKGRLEEIKNGSGFRIFVDFAHTPDSLEAALKYLRTQSTGRLISVFGCAGERDTGKRFKMGKISVELADLSVFTAEDPRSENIFDILDKIAEGAEDAGGAEGKNFVRIAERGEAIAYALSQAKSGDIVGIFGKGHEKSLAYGGFEHPWSDQESVQNYLERDSSTSAIILAAGKGTRMESAFPKILSTICGRPMISYSLQNLRRAKIGEIVAVVSYKKELVIKEIGGAVKIAFQKNPKGGTADSLAAGLPFVSGGAKTVIVMYGDDTAFYEPETIEKVIKNHTESASSLTFVTLVKNNPHGLGRIIRDGGGNVARIVEEKDATEAERKVNEVNDGFYIFDKNWLNQNISKVKKSPVTGEYYLVDLIKMAIDQGKKVLASRLPDDSEWQGVNTPEELERAKKIMEERLK